MKRQTIAEFLLGFFAFPLCALFGLLEAALFHWQGVKLLLCVAFFALFPLLGALKTRQRNLIVGLVTGSIATVAGYYALRPHP